MDGGWWEGNWGHAALIGTGLLAIAVALGWGTQLRGGRRRRLVQMTCLGVFLGLFFGVCWPYGARPAPTGRVTSGWEFAGIEQQAGLLTFRNSADPGWRPQVGTTVYLVEETTAAAASADAAGCHVAAADGDRLTLQPTGDLAGDTLDALLTGSGTWALHETRPDRWPAHYADELAGREWLPAELFLALDPLVSISTAIATRSWVWSLSCAAIILAVGVFVPRAFCGYVCPLGTLIDLSDWAIGRCVRRFRVSARGWWVHIKYYLLAGVLVSAAGGVLVSGFVAPIPVVTRAALFVGEPLQTGWLRGWHLVPAPNIGHLLAMSLFLGVLALGLLQPRFWCRYVCPTGAVFSVANLFRVAERKVELTCVHCHKCVRVCPFDAIKPDFTTRTADCTFCQTCGSVCPTNAIKFVARWNSADLKTAHDAPTGETVLGRRGFVSLGVGTAAALAGGGVVALVVPRQALNASTAPPVRPPGSVPEAQFLTLCVRCGQCFKVCPNNVLQAAPLQYGWNSLWTPVVVADWAGCESSCNACGHVCPTAAIRPLPLDEKRVARMGLAIVDRQACLPWVGRETCDLCVQECDAAGYHAIEYTQVGTRTDESGRPLEGTGMLAPVVLADRCVGCGLCQTRCFRINAKTKKRLAKSAIVVQAGGGREDRLSQGSYRALREQELHQHQTQQREQAPAEFYVPGEQDQTPHVEPATDQDPFGISGPG